MTSRSTLRPVALLGFVLVGACSDADETARSFVSAATACETREVAERHAAIVEEEGQEAASSYASDRCFGVEQARRVRIVEDGFLGAIRGGGRWVRVVTVDGEPLEHHASAQLRRTLGLVPRSEGWVRRRDVGD